MDIKATVDGDTLNLVALNADADTWMGSNNFTPAGPACYTHEASELHQIMICAGWVGLVVTQVDGPVFADTLRDTTINPEDFFRCAECDELHPTSGPVRQRPDTCRVCGQCADASGYPEAEVVEDPNEEWGFCGCGVELSAMTSSDGDQCDDCNDQVVVDRVSS